MSIHDNVYSTRRQHIVDFVFDEQVVAVFPDMIRRSIPGYETVIPLTGLIAARHASHGGTCYDLGCSLGASSLALSQQMQQRVGDPLPEDFQIVAVDNSPAMLQQARKNLSTQPHISWVEADIREIEIENAAAVVLNFTLQFLPPADRIALLTRIRKGLLPHGVLIVSEKICSDDPEVQEYFNSLHLDYKRANGYSELEISQKRNALEKVMLPDTLSCHEQRFQAAGFTDWEVWFRCLNWASFLLHPQPPLPALS